MKKAIKTASPKKVHSSSNDKSKSIVEQNKSNFFINELKEIYSAEKILNSALPQMIKNAKNAELVEGLIKHLQFSKEHLIRLEEVFNTVGQSEIKENYDALYDKPCNPDNNIKR